MASFLRQLSTNLQRRQSDALGATIGTLNPEGADNSMIDSIEELNSKQSEIREKYGQLLLHGASTSAQYQNAVMLTVNAQDLLPETEATELGQNQPNQPLMLDENSSTNGYLKYLTLAAPPSAQGAHYLARTMILRSSIASLFRFSSILEKQLQTVGLDTLEAALKTSALGALSNNLNLDERHSSTKKASFYGHNSSSFPLERNWPTEIFHKGAVWLTNENELITISLSSVFSVLLELNRKDSALCAQALQSLLALLQNLPTETFGIHSHAMILQMHNLLKALRLEGNSQVSEHATSCMIALSIACGTPEFIFASIASLLCDSRRNVPFNQAPSSSNSLPLNFQRLGLTVQNTIQRGPTFSSRYFQFLFIFTASILRSPRNGWLTKPLTEHAQLCNFELVYPGCMSSSDMPNNELSTTTQGCMCSDGYFVYLLSIYGLFKMGTGLTETQAGKVLAHNNLLRYADGSSLIYCNESLYLRRSHSTRLWVIERESLNEVGEVMLACHTVRRSPVFRRPIVLSCNIGWTVEFFGKCLDDSFVNYATPLDDNFVPLQNQRNQRLSCRLMDIGYTLFGDFTPKQEALIGCMSNTLKSSAVDLQFGQAIGFLLTRSGKSSFDTWIELHTEEPIISFLTDAHSNCLIMRSGLGHLFAVGSLSNMFEAHTAKTSNSSSQRVRKIRIPNRRKCTSISGCGGSMAFASENGQCFLHGRHIVNSHTETMCATFGLEHVSVASVGLGKTHLVAISKTGLVYTCGLNNLNQCGRMETSHPDARQLLGTPPPALNTSSPSASQYCTSKAHLFVKDVATICCRCGCCSDRGRACPYAPTATGKMSNSATSTPNRAPLSRGSPCACGAGESTCLRCGICRKCSLFVSSTSQTPTTQSQADQRLEADEEHPTAEEQTSDTDNEPIDKPIASNVQRFTANSASAEAVLMPGRLFLVSSVSVGNYHTILLCADHQVFTFGSNNNGQLGTGDTSKRVGPLRVNLPANVQIVQAVAGANHCVLRTMNGEVITFGAHRAGQLGRDADPLDKFWFARPAFVSGFGQEACKSASWVSAKGNKTTIQGHRRLFSRQELDNCQVTANRECVAVVPLARNAESPPSCALIPCRSNASFQQFPVDFPPSLSWCFDPFYEILWCYDADKVKVLGYSNAPTIDQQNAQPEPSFFRNERQLLQCTELYLPVDTELRYSDQQTALFLLSTVYGLSLSALAAIPTSLKETTRSLIAVSSSTDEELANQVSIANRNDQQPSSSSIVNRFESQGGGWGYSVHCLEAIQFKVNKDINLYGIGLYGGRGENTARIKIFRNVGNSDLNEENVNLLAETNEILYECAAKETAFVGLKKPLLIAADVWHIVWVQVHGTSSDCGSDGQAIVQADGGVEFQFRNSVYSNNGTDVEGGQIPELYYKARPTTSASNLRLSTESDSNQQQVMDRQAVSMLASVSLSAQTVFAITPESLRHIFRVLEWAIRGSFQLKDYDEMQDDVAAARQERAAFIAIISLRMIRIYFGIVFPLNPQSQSTSKAENITELVNCVLEFNDLLNEIFCVADDKLFLEDRIGALMVGEAVEVYVSCAYLLMPSSDVLALRLQQSITSCQRNWRLLAIMKAFCRLDHFMLAVFGCQPESSSTRRTTEMLSERFLQQQNKDPSLKIIVDPAAIIHFIFELAFAHSDVRSDDILSDRLKLTSQELLLCLAKQLVFSRMNVRRQSLTLYQTPRRFRQIITQSEWDTGVEHDAISFKVDCQGIVLQGIGMLLSPQAKNRRVISTIEATIFITAAFLQVFESKTNSNGDSWTLLLKTNGVTSNEPMNSSKTSDIEHCTVLFRLSKPINLKPNRVYAVRVQMDAGKTYYGQSGVAAVQLQRFGRISFMPCASLGKNGTTVARGQIPFLLYSSDSKNDNNKNCTSNERTCIGEEANQLFLLMIRLLSTKLSILITINSLSADCRALCSQMMAYATVFMETNPKWAYNIISAFDQVLPLITAANADLTDEQALNDESIERKKSFGSAVNDQSACSNRANSNNRIQAVFESSHPYKSNDFFSHVVSFDKIVEFICIRFHEECQTAHPDDALWVYGLIGQQHSATALYPVGRFSSDKDWPDGVLIVPGQSSLVVTYGFRCTIDAISTNNTSRGSVTLSNLEQEFAWLCSTACNLIIQSTTKPSNERRINSKDCHELIQKHGVLLQKGLNLSDVPSLAELNRESFPKLEQLEFLADFIAANSSTSGGALATALVAEPYIDLNKSLIEVNGDEFAVGRQLKFRFVSKTQYDNCVMRPDMQVQFVIKRGVTQSTPRKSGPDSAKIMRTLTVFKDLINVDQAERQSTDKFDEHYNFLRDLQKSEPYRSVCLNNARFKSITAMAPYNEYSFEELRWAYELGKTTSETLNVDFKSHIGYECNWTPTQTGSYHLEAKVDGFDVPFRLDFNIQAAPQISDSKPIVPPTPVHRPRKQAERLQSANLMSSPATKISKAYCQLISGYSGARIRTHPALNAHIVGAVPRGANINYLEVVRNMDGTWLRLTDEVRTLYCDRKMVDQAWILQYNEHLKIEHIKLAVVNGNTEGDPHIDSPNSPLQTPRENKQQLKSSVTSPQLDDEVLRPLTVECFRTVFAAYVWHEQLVEKLQECAHAIESNASNFRECLRQSLGPPDIPLSLHSSRTLWSTIVQALDQIVRQHLIMPSLPALRSTFKPRVATFERLETEASNDSNFGKVKMENAEKVCELCGETHRAVTSHMRQKHAGCGGPCFGHGYNSFGAYSTGWSGMCGEGGRGNAIWYLFCPNCRTNALRYHNNENADEEDIDRHWREFRLLTATQNLKPEVIMRRNAIFLLGLSPTNRSQQTDSQQKQLKAGKRPSWTIDLYPTTQSVLSTTTTTQNEASSGNESNQHFLNNIHTSDPGIQSEPVQSTSKVPISLSASANILRRQVTNYMSTVHALPEEDEGDSTLAETNYQRSLTEFALKLCSKSVSQNIQLQPVLAFVIENHDLQAIRQEFEESIRRATALNYAFQSVELLVTTESSVTDIVWQFLNTMNKLAPLNQQATTDVCFATRLRLLPHPLHLCYLAGDLITSQMVKGMHSFLSTLYVILRSDDVDIRLKSLCFRSWTFRLTIHEKNLLYTLCKLLCFVGDVLADNSADSSLLLLEESLAIRASYGRNPSGEHRVPIIKQMDNVSNVVKIEVSSQRNLINCLTDGTSDTFWESGANHQDEDMVHVSYITINWDEKQCSPTLLGIYLDQVRDASYRINQIIVAPLGKNESKTLHSSIVSPKFVGWIHCCLIGCSAVQILLKFNGRNCRVRQLSILGYNYTNMGAQVEAVETPKILTPFCSSAVFFLSSIRCLLRYFNPSQHSDEFAEEQNGTLRQQVLDMLFNRVQLQPLQSYVCTQMVNAIEREIINLRDHKKRNYSYVCGLMVMLMKICESRKGLEVFSMRSNLLIMLSELLLFSPEVVQFQIVETIERLLKHFKPMSIDCSTFVKNLLAVVSKTITLQIKDKLNHKMTSASLLTYGTDIPSSWRADRPISTEIVQLVIRTLSAVANGSISQHWTHSVRNELVNNVMALTKLLAAAGFLPPSSSINDFSSAFTSIDQSTNTSKAILFLKVPQFWLSISALTAISDPAWLEMSTTWRTLKARRNEEPEPFCENHDDGVTLARFHCEACEVFLCHECFAVLHLNKRKKSHTAKLVGSSNLVPKVNVHEGSTRLRLSNLLILFNCAKLSGIAEIGAELATNFPVSGSSAELSAIPSSSFTFGNSSNNNCRFCTNPLKSDTDIHQGVCTYSECQELLKDACKKLLPCGHFCSGILNETKCLPCFTCPSTDNKQDGDDLCVICFTDRLGAAPCIQLDCGHYFHFRCVKTVLEKRWNGPRIVFRFMQCPLCKKTIDHPSLESLLQPLRALYEDVTKKAVLRLEYDGLLKSKPITSQDSEYFKDPTGYALDHYVYVLCSKCGRAYFGGESRCQEALDTSTYKPEELVCGGCSDIAGAQVCGRHGTEFLEYKCKFCCSVAVYFCFGNSHFCSGCHGEFQRLMSLPNNLLPKCPVGPRATPLEPNQPCPLKVKHPDTGVEFSLGCGICRNLITF
ncbi:RCR-type E3 ubiquitin transferase [Aphelenchoides bicaudatus]|nr:RCR-type E3 ubiquitin transferase [Aphelenchoides bicaudatus]